MYLTYIWYPVFCLLSKDNYSRERESRDIRSIIWVIMANYIIHLEEYKTIIVERESRDIRSTFLVMTSNYITHLEESKTIIVERE